jgi:uncharacterized protein (DUF2252 family)
MVAVATRSEPGSVADRMAAGRALREQVPRSSHADFAPPPFRPDPITILEEQARDRLPDLVPIRYGRMASSPFAFLRGSAAVMANDRASTPGTGVDVQACGDAHLANFGLFATPERHIVFDLNDFDETLRGPWEWDVKRLATSFVVAGRHRGFAPTEIRETARTVLDSYAGRIRAMAGMGYLDAWYSRTDAEQIATSMKGLQHRRAQAILDKARSKDHLHAQAKLTEIVDGRRRIKATMPLLQRVSFDGDENFIQDTWHDYRATLPDALRRLMEHYHFADVALKVVGVGSVGTRCFIALFHGRDDEDPLFMQIKEASDSVLAKHLGGENYSNNGERVVEGQRMMQAAGDMLLGWVETRAQHRQFYVRQLFDVKGSVDLEIVVPAGMTLYAALCGATLARAHARSGDAAMIAGYIGNGPSFTKAVTAFADAYADQTERDHAHLVTAINDGVITAETGI